MQELFRATIFNFTDSPQIFRLAFQSAHIAGLPSTDQIRFASIVVDLFFISHSAEGELVFRIGHNQQGQPALQVALEQHELFFETILPSIPPITPADGTAMINEELMYSDYKRLQQHNKDIEQVTFAISHELKNSLTKLKLATSLLEADDDPHSIQKHIQIIQRSSGRLENTLRDLNEIVQIKHGSSVAKPLTPEEIFSKVHDELEEKIIAAQASISTDFGGISGWVYIEVYLQSIFSNLLSNSLKYTYANRRPEIVIKAQKQGKMVELAFSDNGMGIDLCTNQHKLFTPFSRFSSAKYEGKGLGLYIIKSMIERNGGSINVESIVGEGTTFRIRLQGY